MTDHPTSASDLPPPTSGQFLEVSFRRLLKSCEEIIAGDNKGREDLTSWQSSPVFYHYVDTLQEQLADLTASTTKRVETDLLQRYKQCVDRIAGQLRPVSLPAFCLPLPPQVAPATAATASSRSELFRPLQGSQSSHAPDLRSRPGKSGTAHLDDGSRQRLATHEQLQETLTDELVGMAAAMKSSTLALESRLAERGALLEDADDAIQRSLDSARKSRARARQIYTRNKIGFCRTCMALLLVGAVFIGMYMFIRVTYFVGYKV